MTYSIGITPNSNQMQNNYPDLEKKTLGHENEKQQPKFSIDIDEIQKLSMLNDQIPRLIAIIPDKNPTFSNNEGDDPYDLLKENFPPLVHKALTIILKMNEDIKAAQKNRDFPKQYALVNQYKETKTKALLTYETRLLIKSSNFKSILEEFENRLAFISTRKSLRRL